MRMLSSLERREWKTHAEAMRALSNVSPCRGRRWTYALSWAVYWIERAVALTLD